MTRSARELIIGVLLSRKKPRTEYKLNGLAEEILSKLAEEGMMICPVTDYQRLLDGTEADDMITRCDSCGAWLDRDDPACATTADFTGCWKAATGREQDSHLCRSYRALK